MRAFFTETFSIETQKYWIDWFSDVDAAFAPVNNLREAFDDPQVRAREMALKDDAGYEHIGIPIKFAEEPRRIDFRAPELGEHNEEVAKALGFNAGDIQLLKDEGAFG